MIYLIYRSYCPGTAATNRMLSYLGEIEKMNIPVTVVFFQSDGKRSKVERKYRNVQFVYYWDIFKTSNYILKYLVYFINVERFLKRLKKGDVVYSYEVEDLTYKLISKKDVRVYLEKTECPDILIGDTRLHKLNVPKYIEEVKECDGLFVISSNLKNYFEERGVENGKIHIINMIVAPERFDGVEKDKTVGKNIVYCGSAMNTKDGVDDLIKAFAIVAAQITDVTLYVVGAKPKDINNSPVMLAKELGVEDRVVFTGAVSPEKIPQILKNATLLALARPDNIQAKYGFPTKLGEYLLSGNPVVITSVGNIPDYLTDGVDALIAAPSQPEAFAEKLLWGLKHPEESAVIGQRGKNVARKHFDAATETKKLLAVINS